MYGFYRDSFQGTALSQEQFPEAWARAQDVLCRFERDYTVTGSQQDRLMALCALAEAIAWFDGARKGQGGLRYTKVGSVTSGGRGDYEALDISHAARERELYRTALRYLTIYRGAGVC